MTHITVIGTGNMGEAIAGLATKGGHSVVTLDRASSTMPVEGEIVVLATPYDSMSDLVAKQGDALAGKVVVEMSNPVDQATFDGLVVPSGSSAAEQLAQAAPKARVLKAFNTNFAGTLASGSVGPLSTTVLIAGDDADAKALLAQVVRDAGLQAIDVGNLKRARELEALGFLQIALAAGEQISWTGGFAVVS